MPPGAERTGDMSDDVHPPGPADGLIEPVDGLTEERTTTVVRDLLERAAAAHGVYEQQELDGVYDVEWPAWYARHMAQLMRQAGLRLVGPPAPAG